MGILDFLKKKREEVPQLRQPDSNILNELSELLADHQRIGDRVSLEKCDAEIKKYEDQKLDVSYLRESLEACREKLEKRENRDNYKA